MNQRASKETLAQWVSLGLKKALLNHNITKGFETTGIFPLNRTAMDSKLTPSENFEAMHDRARDTLPDEIGAECLMAAAAGDPEAPPEGEAAAIQVEGDEDHYEVSTRV
jgi:hypothetical protein